MIGRLGQAFREPAWAAGWVLRRSYLAYQAWALRRTATVGPRFQLDVGLRWSNARREQLRLGTGVQIGWAEFRIHDRGEVVVGDHCFLGGVKIEAAGRIAIGRRCHLSYDVTLRDNNGHPTDPGERLRQTRDILAGVPLAGSPYRAASADITLGDNVWIGHGAVVLKGVRIGDHAIVGAGSVVTRDVPPAAIAAGNPARVVRTLPLPNPEDAARWGLATAGTSIPVGRHPAPPAIPP